MDKCAHPAGAAGAPGLSERQRKHLRALAHALKPLIRLGSAGLTAAVARETERALRLAPQRARHGRGHRDAPLPDIRLILADHLVPHARTVRLGLQLRPRTEDRVAGVGEPVGFDHPGAGELVLDLLDAALDES